MNNNIRKILLCFVIILSIIILTVYCNNKDNKLINNNIIVPRKIDIILMPEEYFKRKFKINYEKYLKEQNSKVIVKVIKVINPQVKKTVKPKYKLSSYEIDLLERVVMGEAEGEPLDGKIAVAQVVLNRATLWNEPVEDVIYEKIGGDLQFTSVNNGRMEIEPNKESIKAVKLAINGIKTSIDDETLYFYSPDECDSSWHENRLKYVATIGGHKFFKEKDKVN
jgi:spore germination cell wall hydrolase CwlJ-like protein